MILTTEPYYIIFSVVKVHIMHEIWVKKEIGRQVTVLTKHVFLYTTQQVCTCIIVCDVYVTLVAPSLSMNVTEWLCGWIFFWFFFFFGFFFFSFCFLLLFFVLFLERSCTFAKQSWTFKQLNLWTCTMQITIIVLHYNETRFCADFVI